MDEVAKGFDKARQTSKDDPTFDWVDKVRNADAEVKASSERTDLAARELAEARRAERAAEAALPTVVRRVEMAAAAVAAVQRSMQEQEARGAAIQELENA